MDSLVEDCYNVIFSFIPSEEKKTLTKLLVINKNHQENHFMWKQLFSQLYPFQLVLKSIQNYKQAVNILKKSFIDWKNHPDHKDKREDQTYEDFKLHNSYTSYVNQDLMEFAIKTRDFELVRTIKNRQRPKCFEAMNLYEKSLLSAIKYGYIAAFNFFLAELECDFELSGDVLWINSKSHGKMLTGITSSIVRSMLYNGQIVSLKYLETHVQKSTIQEWLKNMDLYRLTKTRKFKSIEYLIQIEAPTDFWFASTGKQSRIDDFPKYHSFNNNAYVVSNFFTRFGEKLKLADRTPKGKSSTNQAKYTWSAVMTCITESFRDNYCSISQKNPRHMSIITKAKHLLKNSFIPFLFDSNADLYRNQDHTNIIFRYLRLSFFPKHIHGLTVTQSFHDVVNQEPELDQKIAKIMWDAVIKSISFCEDQEENEKLLTTSFVTNLIMYVEITPEQHDILHQKGFKIVPFCFY